MFTKVCIDATFYQFWMCTHATIQEIIVVDEKKSTAQEKIRKSNCILGFDVLVMGREMLRRNI